MVDVDRAIDRMTEFLGDALVTTGADGYVVGVSGGLDSAVCATLAVEAVGNDAVTGMILPGAPSEDSNMADARELAADLGITCREVSIAPAVETFRQESPHEVGPRDAGNVRARTRMVFLYLEANVNGLLVLGPSNKSEILLGYFTKYGDGAADLRPMADLYKTEVRQVARALDLDETFVRKAPTAGLWEGQTDEGELGAAYETIDTVLKSLVEADESIEAAAERAGVGVEQAERFRRMMEDSEHKRTQPAAPELPR
ncbi:NAD synthetase [Salinarchaeum sp. Harcht-Bsk1]|uniref:NAD+ synthase n=1 Tax=Salinarchaeum sp. Harcht-Bsk1 TaxID=1333523 RepID=UPI00034242B2|nr:NAD+ synthase [Salinarchaeum sp. Harcht-Bsk1]AGN00843.1 NAD synthetase [Salinarchaeum sp. Harcht-Bsk1]